MSIGSVIVGGKDCSVSKIVIVLRSSPSFHLFRDKFSDIGIHLGTPRDIAKKLNNDYRLLDKLTLMDVVYDLLEDWVARKGSRSRLKDLVRILKDNQLTNCAESLEKAFSGPTSPPKTYQKYSGLPAGLADFLSETNKLKTICIIPSIDVSITGDKLRENDDDCVVHHYEDFLKLISVKALPQVREPLYYATIGSLEQIKKVLAEVLTQKQTKIRLVVITFSDNEAGLQDALQSCQEWQNAVEICSDPLEWNDLTLAYKNELEKKLKELHQIGMTDEELKDGLRGQLLADLINGNDLQLFKDTFPEELNYYVYRKMLTRHYISSKIFDQKSPDIFLVNGIKRYELSGLVKNQLTDMSSIQVRKNDLNVNHIILEHPSHFDKICEKTGSPVHLLQYENGRLKWTRSRGKVAVLQNNLEEVQDRWVETEFCAKLEANSNMSVVIADSPGMGKSVLLARIGKLLTIKFPERLVFFVLVAEFIRQFKEAKIEEKEEGIRICLQNMLCENIVGKLILTSKLNADEEGISVELMMDGFDELNHIDSKLALGIVQTIAESFGSIRLWVTSRQHLLSNLENSIATLGYNIQPFDKDDQAKFLTSYWSRDRAADKQKLADLANRCLTVLKSNMNSKQQDIAGVPLQCLLIAEVYEDDAVSYANPDQTLLPTISISTITDLYTAMIGKKLKKYRLMNEITGNNEILDDDVLLKMHVLPSLELIFPEHASKFQNLFGPAQLEDILKVGILESTSLTTTPRFIHRTFAEYLVAWSFVNPLGMGDLADIFSEGVFNCHYSFSNNIGIESFVFTHPVVCYFIDSLLKTTATVPKSDNPRFGESMDAEDSMRKIAHACVNADLVHIFHYFLDENMFEKYEKAIFNKDFLFLTIEKSSLEFVKLVLGLLEKHQEFDLTIGTTSICGAVRRGDFSIVEYLVNEKDLRSIVEEVTEETKTILHSCVAESRNDYVAVIDQKIDVIRLLIQINPKLMEETNQDGQTPLLSRHIHVRLMTELIFLGSDVLAMDSKNDTILHIRHGLRTLSREDMHIALTSIPDHNLKILVQMKGSHGYTPLASLLQETDPIPDTLTRFMDAGADFNCVDSDGSTVVEVAIKHGRNRETIHKLIGCGAMAHGRKRKTVLHTGAWYGNLEAAMFFIRDHNMDVNIEDDDGLTPLNYALKSDFMHGKRLETGMALHEAGGKFKGIVHSTGQTWLHLSAKNGNIPSIQLLLKLEVDINQTDDDGNTALHSLFIAWDKFKAPITELLLDHEADPNLLNKKGETPFHLALLSDQVDIETFKLLKSKTTVNWTPSLANQGLNILIIHGHDLSDEEFGAIAKEMEDRGADFSFRDDDGNSPLHIAIIHDNMRAFDLLREKQGDINVRNNLLKTPLHTAAAEGIDWDDIKALIEKGADVYAKDKLGETFIHEYVSVYTETSGINSLVKYLATKKLINLFNINGGEDDATPLQLAIRYLELDEETLLVLHKNGANFNAVDNSGESVLGYAVRGQRSVHFLSSLIRYGADWKGATNYKESLLHLSTQHGNKESLKLFLDLGGLDVNGLNEDGNTPVHKAVAKKDKEDALQLCRLLIENGADINILNLKGQTPLQHARMLRTDDGHEELSRLLIADHSPMLATTKIYLQNKDQEVINLESIKCLAERGTNVLENETKIYTLLQKFIVQPKTPTPSQFHSVCEFLVSKNMSDMQNIPGGMFGTTPFQEAVRNLEPAPKTLSLLKSNGVNFDAVDKMGESVLFYSVRGKRSTIFVSSLVNEFGADVEQLNINQESILHIAVRYGTAETLKLILDIGSLNTNCKNRKGNTPLHRLVAFADEKTEVMTKYRLLLGHGADVNSSNNFRQTPLHRSSGNKNKYTSLKLVKSLIDDGANVFARDSDNCTFLHCYISNKPLPTPSEFHDMVEYLHETNYTDLFNEKDVDGQAPILLAVQNLEPEEKTLSKLHSSGVNFSTVDSDGDNILTYAIKGKRSEQFIFMLITQFGISLDNLNKDGASLLHLIACHHSAVALKYFLNSSLPSVHVNQIDNYGSTPLHESVELASEDILDKCKLLVNYGADIKLKDNQQKTPLHAAAGNDDKEASLKTIIYLIEQGADIFAEDEDNNTFFHTYFSSNSTLPSPSQFHSFVESIISKGFADIFNTPGGDEENTSLHLILQHLEPELKTLSLLHSRGVNFNALDTHGDSVLSYAVSGGRSTTLLSHLVTKCGADYKYLCYDGRSLLHIAALEGTFDALQLIIDLGDLDVNGKTEDGDTPLHYVVDPESNNIDVVEKCRLLVGYGADVNIQNNKQLTPLLIAAGHNTEDAEIIKLLLKESDSDVSTEPDAKNGEDDSVHNVEIATQGEGHLNELNDNDNKMECSRSDISTRDNDDGDIDAEVKDSKDYESRTGGSDGGRSKRCCNVT